MRRRITGVIILIVATIASAAAAYGFGINPPIGNVAGAFVSIAVVVLVSRVIRHAFLQRAGVCIHGVAYGLCNKSLSFFRAV